MGYRIQTVQSDITKVEDLEAIVNAAIIACLEAEVWMAQYTVLLVQNFFDIVRFVLFDAKTCEAYDHAIQASEIDKEQIDLENTAVTRGVPSVFITIYAVN